MGNVLEFYLKMKDMMSSGLAKVAQTAKSSFAQVEGAAKKVQQAGANAFGKVGGNINAASKESKYFRMSLDGLKGALDDAKLYRGATRLKSEFHSATEEIKKLEREIATMEGKVQEKKQGGIFGMSWGKVAGVVGLAAMGSSAMGFAKDSYQAANQFQQTTQQYQVLTGSRAGGEELASQLRGMKENTVMGTAVYDNARTMLAFGVQAKDITTDLKMLGDISLGDANRLQHLTLAFSEVQTQGRLTGKEVRQMSLQGFNPLAEIAKTTGKNMIELRKEMKEGHITAAMVTKAMATATGEGGRFHGMLEKMGETGAGKIAKLQGAIASLKIAFGERLAPTINYFLTPLTKMIMAFKHFIEIPIEQKINTQISDIRKLQMELTASNTTHQRQIELLHELAEINPNLTKGINEQSIAYGTLNKNIENVIGALRNKIFVEQLNKNNASTISDYAEAQTTYETKFGESLAMVAQINPDLAARTDLTIGQKQHLAQQQLLAQIKSGKVHKYAHSTTTGMGYGSTEYGTTEGDQLRDLQTTIQMSNNAAGTIAKLQPAINKINASKAALSSSIDKYTGLASLSPSGIPKKDGEDDGSGGKSSLARNMTAGGPRVINIHGVKFMDKLELHTATFKEGVDEMQDALENMFLRILNSGAAVSNE